MTKTTVVTEVAYEEKDLDSNDHFSTACYFHGRDFADKRNMWRKKNLFAYAIDLENENWAYALTPRFRILKVILKTMHL